jgi:hypothetical protein
LWKEQVKLTDKTVAKNKLDIIMRDNGKGTCMLTDIALAGDRNVIEKEAEKNLKYKHIIIEIQRMWNIKTKVITSYNTDDLNHIKIVQQICEQRTGKAGNQGTTDNSLIVHFTHTAESQTRSTWEIISRVP